MTKLMEDSEDNNVNSFLIRIKQPVLLLWGLEDKITPPSIAMHYHDHLPNATLRFISKCGYLPMIEQREQFNQLILEFLDNH